MASHNSVLEELLDEWYNVRKGVIAEIKNIPPARLSFRPTLESRSAADFIHHILEYAVMTTEELTREETNLARVPYEQLVELYAPNISRADTKEKLLDLLVEQYRDAESRFKKVGEIYMLQTVGLFAGKVKTRLSLLQRCISHEMYHRGQLALVARLLGLEPALTRELRLAGVHRPLDDSSYGE